MRLVIAQADEFWTDFQRQVDWYRDHAGPEVAERYVDAVEATLQELAKTPGIGRPRFIGWPELVGIRSWRVQRPYHRHLVFYRFDNETLFAERILHGARDLPRHLLQSPSATDD
jgi:toxin ParE1/3/4